jgi:hypothetical protein
MPVYPGALVPRRSPYLPKATYATLGFSDKANLDEGTVRAVACAEGVDRRRRGKDRRAREESGELIGQKRVFP